jgi:hypothetical protein
MTETISDHSDPDPETIDRVRAALSAEDTIEQSRATGIGPVEYAQTRHGVDPAEHSSHRSLRKALYPDREAELAEREPSDAAKGAAVLAHLKAGKSLNQAVRETGSAATASLSAAEQDRANDLAERAMLGKDAVGVARYDRDPAEHVRDVYDVDPLDFDSEHDLRQELAERNDTKAVNRRRASLRRERRDRKNAELAERRQRELDAQYDDPSENQLASDALGGTDRGRRMTQSERENADYIRDEFGIDPRQFDEPEVLREAIDEAADS